jgi:hypothetical protein
MQANNSNNSKTAHYYYDICKKQAEQNAFLVALALLIILPFIIIPISYFSLAIIGGISLLASVIAKYNQEDVLAAVLISFSGSMTAAMMVFIATSLILSPLSFISPSTALLSSYAANIQAYSPIFLALVGVGGLMEDYEGSRAEEFLFPFKGVCVIMIEATKILCIKMGESIGNILDMMLSRRFQDSKTQQDNAVTNEIELNEITFTSSNNNINSSLNDLLYDNDSPSDNVVDHSHTVKNVSSANICSFHHNGSSVRSGLPIEEESSSSSTLSATPHV